jgi:4-amino-4-deoxy-L-arabinose transferase-like glycosyltransferase
VAAGLALHLVLVVWAISKNSVTFDENFHVPAGVVYVTRGDPSVSSVNPPLVKGMFGLAARAVGAKTPAPSPDGIENQVDVGWSFMLDNADRYHRVYSAARLVSALLSLALCVLVWRFARDLYGPAAGLLAFALYAFSPEALAHGGLATLDVATALAWLLVIWTLRRFARSGRRRDWVWLLGAAAFAALTRFTALLLVPTVLALAWLAVARRFVRHPRTLWLGLLLLVPCVWLALVLGYLGRVTLAPLAELHFTSTALSGLAQALPGFRVPLPDDWLLGLDRQLHDTEAGSLTTYVLGRITTGSVWYYFPLAIALKWPLALLALVALRAVATLRARTAAAWRDDSWLLLPPLLYLGFAMAAGSLNAGVRYMLPILPFLCVWCAGLLAAPGASTSRSPRQRTMWATAAVCLALIQPIELATAWPYPLTFFNAFAAGRGDRLLNDSNVDWGQGLIALREELRRRGITRVHLLYHGTLDPSVYSIGWVPYLGGDPGRKATGSRSAATSSSVCRSA